MTHKPDYHHTDEFQNRTRKLDEIRKLGLHPYPHKFSPSHKANELHTKFGEAEIGHSEDAEAGTTERAVIAGRLVLFRAMGKNAFAHLQDDTGRLQIMLNKNLTELIGYEPSGENHPKPIKVIEKMIDLGDLIGVEGHLFHTHKGELTLYAKKLTLLCKTLLPLPDKHAGLADKETRYRKRWLDLISNEEIKETFLMRSQILKTIRDYNENQGFLEVETPVMQSIYGGAEARPFTTNLHALNQDMFLRISLEIPLKKLIVGGMDKVFELGRVFRNEGIDRNHNPEFTMLEAYATYWDYNDMMSYVENLFEKIAIDLFGKTTVSATDPEGNPVELEMKAPWQRMTMKGALQKYAGLNVDEMGDEEIRERLKQSGHVALDRLILLNRGLLIAALFEVEVEPHLIQPHHITDHPIETTPLCKPHRDPNERDKGIVERFESFILSQEICNAYTELNDPELQRKLLEEQEARRDAGDEEASPLDEEFIEAICQGMPPTGGVGIGIDRLVMLFTHSHSIRDVLYFPWMKPI